jgi:hypothetical protein
MTSARSREPKSALGHRPRKTTVGRENQRAIRVAVGPEPWHCSRTETGQPGSATEGQPEVGRCQGKSWKAQAGSGPVSCLTTEGGNDDGRHQEAEGASRKQPGPGQTGSGPGDGFRAGNGFGGPETDQPEGGTLGCRSASSTTVSSRKRRSTKVQVRA